MSNVTVLTASRQALENWIVQHDFKGWDPFDALRSPLLRKLTFGNRRIGQLWVQLFKHSPVNFRQLFAVEPGHNPKAMGLFLETYLRKAQIEKTEENLERAIYFSNWLQENYTKGFHGYCWGYNFDWPNRGFFAPAGTPTIVNTAFIGSSFLEMYKISKTIETPPELKNQLGQGLKIARSACDFILSDLHVLNEQNGSCFSYTPLDNRYIHNANMLGAMLLANVSGVTGESQLSNAALSAARYTVNKQMSNGGWLYGEDSKDQWNDNFHSGYVLVSLKKISSALSTTEFAKAINQGYLFWKKNFLHADGSVSYYANKKYPVDIHAVSQTILTLLEFSDDDSQALELAWRTAHWAIKYMQDSQGFFYYQLRPQYINKIAYMRWAQAWMFYAFTELERRTQ